MTSDHSNRFVPIAGIAVLLLAGGAAFALFGLRGSDEVSKPEPAQPPAAVTPETPPQPLPAAAGTVEIQTPEQAGVPLENCISYPDGTKLPPLNGVEKAPRISFHRMIPYTKIVGRHTDSRGVEWYVHENGAMSTTRFQMRNGNQEAVGELMMPTTPSGIVDK